MLKFLHVRVRESERHRHTHTQRETERERELLKLDSVVFKKHIVCMSRRVCVTACTHTHRGELCLKARATGTHTPTQTHKC